MARPDRAAKYVKLAKAIETRYQVPVYVIRKNPKTQTSIPWISPPDGIGLYVVESEHSMEKVAQKVRDRLSRRGISVQQTYPIEELIAIVKAKPALLTQGLGGMGFLVPLMFNEPVYGKEIVRDAVKQLKRAFGAELKTLIRQRITRYKEAKRKMQEERLAANRKAKERLDLLVGPLERKELTHAIMDMAKKVAADENPVLIAFDRSGRPVGIVLRRVLKEAFGLRVPLYFLDPTIVKRGVKFDAHAQFEKEYPGLAKRLPNSTAVVVDDQIWQGNSLAEMKKLLDHYRPKKSRAFVLSHYPAEPPPSWRHRNVLGIETLKEQFKTKRSADKQTEVNAFRRQLKRVARGVTKRLQRSRK